MVVALVGVVFFSLTVLVVWSMMPAMDIIDRVDEPETPAEP